MGHGGCLSDVVQDGEELLTLVWSEGEADGGSCTLAGRDLVSTGFRVWFGIPRSRREPLKFETSFHGVPFSTAMVAFRALLLTISGLHAFLRIKNSLGC